MAQARGRISERSWEEALGLVEKMLEPQPVVRRDPANPAAAPKTELVAPEIAAAERAAILEVKAVALHGRGRGDEAIAFYEESIQLDPTPQARKNIGKLYFQRGRYADAAKSWESLIRDGNLDAEMLFLHGQAQRELYLQDRNTARLEAARIAVQASLLRDATDLRTRRLLAVLEFESGRFAEAARLLENIRKEFPLDPEYLEFLANAYIQLKDYDKAIDQLELAVRLSRPRVDLCESLGELYAQKNEPGKAAEWWKRACGNRPEKARPADRFYVAQLLADAGDRGGALTWLAAIAESDKEHLDAQSLRASLLEAEGKEDEALAVLERLRGLRPQDGSAHLSAGSLLLARKDLEAAQQAFASAASLSDSRADGLAGLAEVAYARGDLKAAVDQYHKALEARPGERRYEIALRQIEEELRLKEESAESVAGG
jgi:tetratricopeptide (TPR) repeat protein